jgi:ParB-like chromosome segregation protein Spo0J
MTASCTPNRLGGPGRPDATTASPMATTVPITSLLPGNSPRFNGENAEHIQILAASGASLPPVLVHRQTMRVIDGTHRLRAALLRGEQTTQARFFDGDDDAAFVEAVRANTRHGLALTLAEREAAAARITAAYPDRSDRWVADITGLAAGTVARVRRLTDSGHGPVPARVGRDGRVRPLNSAEGRRLAGLAIAEHPEASLRDIARLAGISPSTVRDVRERVRRGADPVPPPRRYRRGRPRQPPAARPLLEADGVGNRDSSASGTAEDRSWLLHNLRKDPALRYSDSGRALLAWLDTCASGPGRWQALLEAAPPHCAYAIVELARRCADEWLDLAVQVERRLEAMT